MSELTFQRALRVTDLKQSWATKLKYDTYFDIEEPIILRAGVWAVWYEDPGPVLQSMRDDMFDALYVLEHEAPQHMRPHFHFLTYEQWCEMHNIQGEMQ